MLAVSWLQLRDKLSHLCAFTWHHCFRHFRVLVFTFALRIKCFFYLLNVFVSAEFAIAGSVRRPCQLLLSVLDAALCRWTKRTAARRRCSVIRVRGCVFSVRRAPRVTRSRVAVPRGCCTTGLWERHSCAQTVERNDLSVTGFPSSCRLLADCFLKPSLL